MTHILEKDIMGKIEKLVQDNKQDLEDQSGIPPSMTTEAAREQIELIVTEMRKAHNSKDRRRNRTSKNT